MFWFTSFFSSHMSDHHLAKGRSLSSVQDSETHSLLVPDTRLLYQYSVPCSKHTSSKLRSLPRLFTISLTVFPDFDSCFSHFMPYRMTPCVRHMAMEVHNTNYYYHSLLCVFVEPDPCSWRKPAICWASRLWRLFALQLQWRLRW